MSEKVFPKGVRIFQSDSAPDFVIGNIVISLNELVKFGKDHPEYLTEYKGAKQLKLQALKSKEGKAYLIVDTYKRESDGNKNEYPEPQKQDEIQVDEEDLPF